MRARTFFIGIVLATSMTLGACSGINSDASNIEEPAGAASYQDYLAGELSLNELISPELGVWVIYRPGAMDALTKVGSADELFEQFRWLEDSIETPECIKGEDPMPEVDCDSEEMLPAGICWAKPIKSFDRPSKLLELLVEYELADGEQLDELRDLEQQVEVKALIGGQDTALYFGRVDGAWQLLFVDAAEFDCSA